jgi:hypothetical protein
MASIVGGTLVVVLDCSGSSVCFGADGAGFQDFVMQLLVFMNAHLAIKPQNSVALYGYKHGDR